MNTSFSDLGVSPSIIKAIEEMGFENPTEVQKETIPHILDGKDVIVKSKTGSGKTAVFGISMIQMIDPNEPGPQGLILTPTRELAVQVENDLKKMSRYQKHRITSVYGQHSMNTEVQVLKRGVSIIAGTPGRVYDHIESGNLSTKNIRFLVLDEADRMLDMGFLDQVVRIIKTIPRDRVTLLFSATMPAGIHRICRSYMKQPITIEIESQTKTVDTIKQQYLRVNHNEKNTQLNRILLTERPDSCMIFCNTKLAVDRVQNFLYRKGYASQALHGDIPQSKRMKTIQQFKQGEFRLLIATDVAARGIHIDSLGLVINYDVPNDKDSYVHRIGRTGRAGNDGHALTLVTGEDIMSLYAIEEHIGVMIPEAQMPSEEEYNAHKAEADKWVQENSHNVRQHKHDSEPVAKEAHRKPYQKNDNKKDRQGEFNKGYSKGRNNEHYKEQRKENYNDQYGAKRTRTENRSSEYPKTAHAAHKAAERQPRYQSGANMKHTADTAKNQTAPVKESFIKRILKRIFK